MGAALGVVVVLITVLAIPSKEWLAQRARIASLEESLSVTRANVDSLTQTAARWQDPAYIEAQARARLHFVRPGEVGYVVLTDEHQQESTPGTRRALAAVPSGGPWWSAVWSTVTEAAKPGDPDAQPAPAPAQAAPEYGP